MTIRELAKFLDITTATIYNWRESKPKLYDLIMNFKKTKEQIQQETKTEKIIKLIEQLSEKEQEYYLTLIKADILKRELGK